MTTEVGRLGIPAADPDSLREHVLAQMVPGRREDDIAVLVVRFDDSAKR